jgi:hypothetical protein
MLQLVADDRDVPGGLAAEPAGEFAMWTGYRIPDERSGWHPTVRHLYDYWLSIAPAGRLPGRQHIVPEDIVPLWSRLWMLDVSYDPLRYRYRRCGSEMVRSLGREVTGAWLDEVHPQLLANPLSRERFRFMVATRRATWRRGPPLWTHDPDHRLIETCIVPLAADGCTVDKLIAVSVVFDADGAPI